MATREVPRRRCRTRRAGRGPETLSMDDYRWQARRAALALVVAQAQGSPCRLCGAPGKMVGVWAPDRPTMDLMGVPRNKARICVYSLCPECRDDPGAGTRIEDLFIAESTGPNPEPYLPA